MSSNIRILYANAADSATLSASTTAGSLGVANLLTDVKSEVWRSTATTATLTATWAAAQICSVVALPFCNLTSTATLRVRGYTLAADATAAFDTTARLACAYAPLGLWDWGALPLGVNAFSYAGGACAVSWFAAAPVQKLVIDLEDASNPAGYIEAGRLVCGSHWSPTNNPEYGASLAVPDSTKTERTDAGDPISARGHRHRQLAINLVHMLPADRARCHDILTGNGLARPVFVSLFPEHADPQLEQSHQLYGRLASASAITVPGFGRYAAPLTIEEI